MHFFKFITPIGIKFESIHFSFIAVTITLLPSSHGLPAVFISNISEIIMQILENDVVFTQNLITMVICLLLALLKKRITHG